MLFPNIFWGIPFSQIMSIVDNANGDTVAFHEIGLQRNESLTSMSGQLAQAHTDNTEQTRDRE